MRDAFNGPHGGEINGENGPFSLRRLEERLARGGAGDVIECASAPDRGGRRGRPERRAYLILATYLDAPAGDRSPGREMPVLGDRLLRSRKGKARCSEGKRQSSAQGLARPVPARHGTLCGSSSFPHRPLPSRIDCAAVCVGARACLPSIAIRRTPSCTDFREPMLT